MTTHSPERAAVTLPTQAAPVQPSVEPAVQAPVQRQPSEQPVDHVRTHGSRCYWDLRDCRWVCARP